MQFAKIIKTSVIHKQLAIFFFFLYFNCIVSLNS